jgi:hypothetical protein
VGCGAAGADAHAPARRRASPAGLTRWG